MSHAGGIKTAVSLPDDVFKAAEGLARRLHLSRSALYARALRRLLAEEYGARVTERLNVVYSEQDSSLDPGSRDLQTRSLSRERW